MSYGIDWSKKLLKHMQWPWLDAAFSKGKVNRIILTRPAVEAGEALGFLPGDLAQKVDPYLRPLYDALHDMMQFEKVSNLIEQGIIEVAPLALNARTNS